MNRICLVNVGVNSSHGSLRSPVFSNGEFEFVPIPDRLMDYLGASVTRYEDLKSWNGISFDEFIQPDFYDRCTHNDPEFVSRTYGDYPAHSPRAANLQKLSVGDFMFFLARLVKWRDGRFSSEKGFYLVGGLEIASIYRNITKKPSKSVFTKIKRNAHIERGESNPLFYDGFWVFKGTRRVGRFRYAIPFDRTFVENCSLRDRNGKRWRWNGFRTELSAIGSYLRSVKVIDDEKQITRFRNQVSKYGEVPD